MIDFILAVLLTGAALLFYIRQEKLMDDTSKLTTAVDNLSTDVQALIAKPSASVQPAIDAQTARVEALDASVKAALSA